VHVNAARLTVGVLSALEVNPQLGRVFTADEVKHSQQVAVLSYTTWVGFHRDTQILGTKILLNRKPFVVIGVMPRNVEFPLVAGQLNRAEVWVPLSFAPQNLTRGNAAHWSYQMVGQLKPGVSARNRSGCLLARDGRRPAKGIQLASGIGETTGTALS
jgi:hypothetical protein